MNCSRKPSSNLDGNNLWQILLTSKLNFKEHCYLAKTFTQEMQELTHDKILKDDFI
jgi:hypothetical protein